MKPATHTQPPALLVVCGAAKAAASRPPHQNKKQATNSRQSLLTGGNNGRGGVCSQVKRTKTKKEQRTPPWRDVFLLSLPHKWCGCTSGCGQPTRPRVLLVCRTAQKTRSAAEILIDASRRGRGRERQHVR
ncbi:unnamed protein product, partial [Ectocarpus sp. 12 AP-2014]